MYELEIETNKTVKRIQDPRKAKVVDVVFTSYVKVMDGNGKWTTIGHCFLYQDAQWIADEILKAIKKKIKFIEVDLD